MYPMTISKAFPIVPDTENEAGTARYVKSLQVFLTKSGYPVVENGLFTAATDHAIKAFQRDHGLEPNGVCDSKMWQMLLPPTVCYWADDPRWADAMNSHGTIALCTAMAISDLCGKTVTPNDVLFAPPPTINKTDLYDRKTSETARGTTLAYLEAVGGKYGLKAFETQRGSIKECRHWVDVDKGRAVAMVKPGYFADETSFIYFWYYDHYATTMFLHNPQNKEQYQRFSPKLREDARAYFVLRF